MSFLFLDFDGVMHRTPVRSNIDLYFEHINILVAWLRKHKDVQVVVSSSWRTAHPIDELQDLLFHEHEDLRDRFAGANPDMSKLDEDFERSRECRQWLHDHGHHFSAWVAADDQPELFSPDDHDHLVVCDPNVGLTQAALDQAWQLIERQLREEEVRRARNEQNGSPMSHFDRLRLRPLPHERAAAAKIQTLTDAEEAHAVAMIASALSETEEVDRQVAAAAVARHAAWCALPEGEQWATLFLDLDEVLCVGQPTAAGALLQAMKDGADQDHLLQSLFSPSAIAALREVHDQMAGKLRYVISSSWREHFSREQVELIFRRTGLAFVADALHPGAAWRCYQAWFKPDRSADIEEWIEKFGCGEPFAVLDDTYSGGSLNFHRHLPDQKFYGRVVLCKPGAGFTADHVDDIVGALQRPVWRLT